MNLIRIFTVGLSFFLFGLGSLFLSFLLFPLVILFAKKENRRKIFVSIIHKCWKIFSNIMSFLKVMKVEFSEPEKFRNLRGKIIVANHPSLIDIVLLIGEIPNSVSVVKYKLAANFFVQNIVSNAYLINDSNIENFKTDAKKLLENGFNIVIFPTGTRTVNNEDLKLHHGAAALALENDTEIIPVKIDIDYPFLPKNINFFIGAGKKRSTFKIKLMPQIVPADFLKNDISSAIARKNITKKIKEACF